MYSIWYPVDNEGKKVNHIHIGGENPSEANGLPVGGDSSFPVLGNPNPNTPVPTYGILDEDYIQVFDRQANRWEFLYLNRNQTQNTVSQSGISYDRSIDVATADKEKPDVMIIVDAISRKYFTSETVIGQTDIRHTGT